MKRKGFSLIEIIVILFIAVTFVMLVVGLLTRSRDFGRAMVCVNNLKQISQALENYQADWKDTPAELTSLSPAYIANEKTFRCPADKASGNSYDKFYIPRFFGEENSNKIFLICNRHFKFAKTIGAYLSYAVDVGASQKVLNNTYEIDPNHFGDHTYGAGSILKFTDGTTVEVQQGEVGVLASFISNQGNAYSVVYEPEQPPGSTTKIYVNHEGKSQFEVVTPAVIAGVEGTKFWVTTTWYEDRCVTQVVMDTGQPATNEVAVIRRSDGEKSKAKIGQAISAVVGRRRDALDGVNQKKIPKKPPKYKEH